MPLPGPVLHVSAARGWRGGEQQLVSLAGRLAAAGVAQRVLCTAGSRLERVCRARGLAVEPVAPRLGVDPRLAWAVARGARASGAAVVHAHDPHAHTAAVLAASLLGMAAPVVAHRKVDFPVGRGVLSAWKWGHRSVRRIVCVSEAVAAVVRREVADGGRIVVVRDGVDLGRFGEGLGPGPGPSPSPRPRPRPSWNVRSAFGVPEGVPLVGTVAALVPHKDHATFLEVAALLRAAGCEAHFLLVGDGPLRGALEARARALGLGGRVHFAGFRDDVPALLPALDLFLFTSREEGLGSSILDAWACGIPVVATAAGGIPELVRDGETGLLAPVGDAAALAAAVRRLLAGPALRAALVAGAAARLPAFGIDRMAEGVLAVYREVAAEARAAGAANDSDTRAFGSFLPKSRLQR